MIDLFGDEWCLRCWIEENDLRWYEEIFMWLHLLFVVLYFLFLISYFLVSLCVISEGLCLCFSSEALGSWRCVTACTPWAKGIRDLGN